MFRYAASVGAPLAALLGVSAASADLLNANRGAASPMRPPDHRHGKRIRSTCHATSRDSSALRSPALRGPHHCRADKWRRKIERADLPRLGSANCDAHKPSCRRRAAHNQWPRYVQHERRPVMGLSGKHSKATGFSASATAQPEPVRPVPGTPAPASAEDAPLSVETSHRPL